MKKLQEWYPDPPVILFISNNEHSKLSWWEVDIDRRYIALYGSEKDDNFKRQVVGDGWINSYKALMEGMRSGFTKQAWKNAALFIGYEAFGTSGFARWKDWINYSLYRPGRIEPWPLVWDGGSPSYYVFNWSSISDFQVFSQQVQFMNLIFMQKEAYQLNPQFWFEISTWDGYEPTEQNDKRAYYASLGQTYNPERYGGMVQFGMWLTRPRTVREFRSYNATLADNESYFLPIVTAVDNVHNSTTLRKFWRKGQLVANTAQKHPFQVNVPSGYSGEDRWFLLDTSIDPPRPWTLLTELPVYSLAMVIGTSPEREWLVYIYSPLMVRSKVTVQIPSYGPIIVDPTPSGVFYLVKEKDKMVTPVSVILPPKSIRAQ